jgi:flagellar biogenesis protein FliO
MSGIALALAVFGGVSLASRRFLPGRGTGPLQVVGRTSLSPKHTVYLLRAGDRVLIVGTGSQGAPSLLGEWTGPMDRWLSSQQANVSAPGFEPSNGDEP